MVFEGITYGAFQSSFHHTHFVRVLLDYEGISTKIITTKINHSINPAVLTFPLEAKGVCGVD